MKLKINGCEQEIQTAQTLEELIKEKKLITNHIVIELNARIIPREQWSETTLQKGDSLEIVSFVGGG